MIKAKLSNDERITYNSFFCSHFKLILALHFANRFYTIPNLNPSKGNFKRNPMGSNRYLVWTYIKTFIIYFFDDVTKTSTGSIIY